MDLYKDLLLFYDKLKEYKVLLSKLYPNPPIAHSPLRVSNPFSAFEDNKTKRANQDLTINEIETIREYLIRNSPRLNEHITRLTGKNTINILDIWNNRTINVWDVGLQKGYSNLIAKALDACLDYTNEAIGKLEAEGKSWNIPIKRIQRAETSEDIKQEAQEKTEGKVKKSVILSELCEKYLRMKASARPQDRGYELEKLLYELFELFKLSPSKPFKITGEQIDGSFMLEGTDFLLEAQWEKVKPTAEELYGFQGKVSRKFEGTRGLFVSISGFSPSCLEAFGKGTTPNILLMDGEDLAFVFEGRIDLKELLSEKRRHASRTGDVYLKARSLVI